jgi:hypothetical protein
LTISGTSAAARDLLRKKTLARPLARALGASA